MEQITLKGKFVFEIISKNHWINSFPGAIPKLPTNESYIWIDKNGDTVNCGEDFSFAEEIQSYPIRIYHLQRVSHLSEKNKSYVERLNDLLK